MKKYVLIKETLEKILEVDVPDNMTSEEETRQAIEEARSRYYNGMVVLNYENLTDVEFTESEGLGND